MITVAQLIEHLHTMPQDAVAFIDCVGDNYFSRPVQLDDIALGEIGLLKTGKQWLTIADCPLYGGAIERKTAVILQTYVD